MVVGEQSHGAPDPMRRFLLRWGIVFGAIVLGFAATVILLNATLYSAEGFARSYLSALARQDATSARAAPGVVIDGSASADLLSSSALGDLDAIDHVASVSAGGVTRTRFSFELDGSPSTAQFEIERDGSRLGFFRAWRFAVSPTGILEVDLPNTSDFDANGLTVDAARGAGAVTAFHVLTPAVFALGHESEYLVAETRRTEVPSPGATVRASVSAAANPAFVDLVQDELDALLDACAEQAVLQPSGCPFGETIANRVVSEPEWSIAAYPAVTIAPAGSPGTWQVPPTTGAAHLLVEVQSLFDGTRSTFDEDVPFSVGYLISFPGDGSVKIAAR